MTILPPSYTAPAPRLSDRVARACRPLNCSDEAKSTPRPTRAAVILVGALFCSGAGTALGQSKIYKSTDQRGGVTYSDRLMDQGSRLEVLKVPPNGNAVRRDPIASPSRSEAVTRIAPLVTLSGPAAAPNAPSDSTSGQSPIGAATGGASGGTGAGGGGVSAAAGPATHDHKADAAGAGAVGPLPKPPPPPAPAPAPSVVEDRYRDLPASTQRCDVATPDVPSASVRVEDYGAKGDGETDDTNAINQAISSLSGPGRVLFQSGRTYRVRRNISVNRPGAVLWGNGATLDFFITPQELAGPNGSVQISVQLLSPGAGAHGLRIISNLTRRLPGHSNHYSIFMAGDRQWAIGNRIEYTHVGILAYTATNFVIACNSVVRTYADAIHVTQGSQHGLVKNNFVRENGDDMIAVVNYGAGEPTVGDVLIEANDVSGTYWGRGIAVVGGRDVTIRGNRIGRTARCAGILLHAESAYDTANIRNVIVEDNDVQDVQTKPAAWNPIHAKDVTGHGGIDVFGQDARKVSDILIRNNRLRGVQKYGLFVRGNACRIGLEGNSLSGVGVVPVYIDSEVSDGCNVECAGNTNEGQATGSPRCGGPSPTVTGANL